MRVRDLTYIDDMNCWFDIYRGNWCEDGDLLKENSWCLTDVDELLDRRVVYMTTDHNVIILEVE